MGHAVYQLAVVANDVRARRAFVLLLVGAACIALAPIFVRLSAVGPVPTAFWRAALAVPFLAALVPLLPDEPGRARWPGRWRDLLAFAVPGFMFAGDLATWHFAIHYTSVANATLLPNTAPIFVAVFGFLLYGTRFTRRFLLGMVLALAGVSLLMGESLRIDSTHVLGDALAVVTAMFYGGYFLAVARLRAEFATAAVMTFSIAFTALFLVPVAWIAGGPWLPSGAGGWAVLAGLALVSQTLGQGLIAYAFAYLPPAFGAVSLLLQPVLAAVFAWVLFSEALGPVQTGGIAIVLAGVLLARQGALRNPVPRDG
ncbi:MAG: DMT family transporter [Halofilum sp. (in: g-proteobacteria)]